MGTPLSARQALAQIEHDFQVVDDVASDWSPKLFGFVPVPWVPSRQITITEGKLLDRLILGRGYFGLRLFKDIAIDAGEEANKQYPPPSTLPPAAAAQVAAMPAADGIVATKMWGTNDGHNDAFRHCYWNARLAVAFGAQWTRAFTTAHEGLEKNPAVREAMDLYNNSIGRRIAARLPGALPSLLAAAVRKAADAGDLVVVGADGHLAWSDQVAFGQHGIALPGASPGVLATPGVVSVW